MVNLSFDVSLNDGVFVGNNPVNWVDPDGLSLTAVGAGAGLAIGGPPGAVAGAVVGTIAGAVIGQAIWDNWFANESDEGEQCEFPTTPPDGLVENPHRPGSWGEIGSDDKFKEKWRRDEGRPGIKSGHGAHDHIHVGDKWDPITK